MLVVEHLAHFGGVHGGVPRHVRHEDQQGVDAVGVTTPGVGDDVVHQAVGRQRVLPGEALVDAHRLALVVDKQIVRTLGPAQRRTVQRRVGLDGLRPLGRTGVGRHGARVGRLVPEAARAVDGAQQRHQDGQRADRLKAVGVRRQAAHGVKGHRVAGDRIVALAPAVGPGDGQLDLLVTRGDAHLVGQAADGGRRNAGDALGPLRGVGFDALFEQLEGRHGSGAVGQLEVTQQGRVGTFGVVGHALLGEPVPPVKVGRAQRVDDVALGVAQEHAEVVAGRCPGSPADRRWCSAPETRGRTGPA